MDAETLWFGVASIVISVLLGVLFAFLHSMNEKISDIRTELAEIKGIVSNIPKKK